MATRKTLLIRFAAQAGRIAGDSAGKHSTAERAWAGIANRLDALPRVGPRTLAKLERVFLSNYHDAQAEKLAARGLDSFFADTEAA